MLQLKKKVIDSITAFIQDSRATGIILLLCTFFSLLLSNIEPVKSFYTHFWNYSFSNQNGHFYTIGFISLPNSVNLVINDFLMVIFFLLAGMEIRRELHHGELSSLKKSMVPLFGAIGGMIAPAILFTQINSGTDNMNGWAIPMATDIAFTLGVASLLGKKVPVSLKIFLTALAIIDDLGAIMVIALFYGGHLKWIYLVFAALILAIMFILQRQKKSFGMIHIILGLLLWYTMFNSGIHATVAGVIFAFVIPANSLERLEAKLHLPVYFFIIPIFALANTAITISKNTIESFNSTLTWGIIAGLCIGKPLGICGTVYYLVKKRWATLPHGVSWQHLIGGGILAGIGFTMSIFIAVLAFDNTVHKDDVAKLSVLIASFISMLAGYLWLKKAAKAIHI